jgi:outer membrane protein TolC
MRTRTPLGIVALGVVLALSPRDSRGGETPRQALTLPEAIAEALQRSPLVAAAAADARAAGSDRDAARGARLPRVGLEAGLHRTDNQVAAFGDKLLAGQFTAADFAIDQLNHPDPVNHAGAAVVIEAPLYTAGRLSHRVEEGEAEAGAAAARQRGAEADIVLAVTAAYQNLVAAGVRVEIARQALTSAEGHERLAEAQAGAGAALRSDRLRAQVQRLARAMELEAQQSARSLARTRLALLLGRRQADAEAVVVAASDIEAPPDAPEADDLASWLERARLGRPEIEEARRGEEGAAARAAAADADHRPEVAGTARYERNALGFEDGTGAYFAGVTIRWNAIDAGRGARLEAERWRSAASHARRSAVEDHVALDVEEAWRAGRLAAIRAALAREAVGSAEEARRIVAERYAAGLLPLTDLLDVEDALLQARLADVGARLDASLARARLARAVGGEETEQ